MQYRYAKTVSDGTSRKLSLPGNMERQLCYSFFTAE